MKRLVLFFALLASLCLWSSAEAASITKLSLSPTPVAGGGTVKGTVTILAAAPDGGLRVTLDSSSTYADVPSSVTVPKGKRSASFTITTNATSIKRNATITSTVSGSSRTATLTIDPVGLYSVKASPTVLTSDSSVVGTVTLNGVAPSGGYVVALSENSSVADTPSSVTVPAGAKTATFAITSEPVTSISTAAITASAAGITKTTSVSVSPLALTKLAANSSLTGGNDGGGKITFNGKTSAAGASVSLVSSMPGVVSVPSAVTAPADSSTASFPITTSPTTTQRAVVITATYRGVSKSYTVTVKPIVISSISSSPSSIVGSQAGVININLTGEAPAGGIVATLSSSDARLAIPTSVSFEAGVVSMSVPITTELVTSTRTVTVTATVAGISKTSTVTLVPISVGTISLVASPTGGNASSIKFVLNAPAPAGGIVVELSSSDPSMVSLPESIEFMAGERTVEVEYLPAVVGENTSVNVSARFGSITKTATITIIPAKFLNFGLVSSTMTGGRPAVAIVTLSGPASDDGLVVELSAAIVSPSGAQVPIDPPATVLVPAGERALRFSFDTDAVTAKTVVAITASSNGRSVTPRLTLDPAALLDFNPRPIAVRPDGDTQIVIRLTGDAPAGGVLVTLSSSKPAIATVPVSVTIPEGSRTVSVNVSGASDAVVGTTTTIKVTALGKSLESAATVSNLLLTDLALSTESTMGGNLVTGTVTLNGPATTRGVAVGIDVLDSGLSVPGSVMIPAGQTTASFTITTALVQSPRSVVIYARFASSVRTADLYLNVLGPISLAVDDPEIEGGETLNATITLNSVTPPSGGAVVNAYVFSSNDDAVHIPGMVVFARSSLTATFGVTGVPVRVPTVVTLVVEVNGQTTNNVQLTINPPRVDTVSVASAELTGGADNTGTVRLTNPAPAGGWTVQVASSSGSAIVETSVTVPAGASSKTFSIATSPVTVLTNPVITAGRDGVTATATFTVKPPRLTSLSIADNDLEGGFATTTGTITLDGPAPAGGWTVALSSSSSASSSGPASVTVAANVSSATFAIGSSLVPADASVTLSANKGADTFNQAVTVRQIKVTGLTLSAATVQGGTSVTATITINRSVPSGGVAVNLSDNSSAASIAASATVPVNQTTVTATVSTTAVAANTVARITATFNGGSAFADVTVLAPVVSTLSASPTTLVGGWATTTGDVAISHVAPVGGFPVDLTASNGGASVPASVTIAAGSTSATFTIATAMVAADRSVTITASRNGVERTTTVVVMPLVISGLTISPSPVIGSDQSATATLTLNGNAPAGGAVVALSSSHTTHASVPATVSVPAGTSSTTFTVATLKKSTPQAVTVTATYNEASRTAGLQVNAPTPTSLAISPGNVVGGGSVTGTITLNTTAPTGGLSVAISSNNLFASVPGSVTVPAASNTATVTVSTFPIGANGTVTITVSANGVSRTASFTVNAPTLTSVSLGASTVTGGSSLTATAVLSSAAPSGGLTITMASNKTQASPVNIVVAAGETQGTSSVATQAVAANTAFTITGTLNGTSKSANATITAPTLTGVSLSTSSVLGGGTLTATAVLTSVAPAGGLTITMTSDRTQATSANIVIAAGQTQGTASVATQGVVANTTVTLTGALNGTTRTATFTINRTTIASVSVNPTAVRGGNTFTFTLTLNGVAPAGGLTIESGDNSGNIAMPVSIFVPAGSNQVTITVGTNDVGSDQTKQVGISYESVLYYTNLTLLD